MRLFSRWQRRGAAIAFAVLISSTLAACGASAGQGGGDSDPTATGKPVSGGSLTYLSFSESNGLDPVLLRAGARAGDSDQATAIFDTLVYLDPKTQEVVPKIAESLTSEDNITWELKIRDGVTFTDGTPYDAEAVKFNWERIGDPKSGSPSASGMEPVANLEVVDPLTLRITLKSAYPLFPQLVARYLSYIGSPTAIKKLGDGFAQAPVGAGPFVVKSWVRDSELRLVKNPNYWQKGLPYLDELVIQQVPDDEQRFNTFSTGAAQAAIGGPNTVYADRARKQGFKVESYVLGGGINLIFNTRKEPFNDVELRRAVAQALDLPRLNEILSQGTNSAPTTFFTETSPFHEPDITFPTHDKQAAQRVFDAYAAKTGGPLKIDLTATTAAHTIFEMVQAQLSEYNNVEVNLKTVQNSALTPLLIAGNYQVANYANYADDFEPTMFAYFHSKGARNYTGISDPELDAALEEGRASSDPKVRKEAYRRAQQRIVELVPDIYIQQYQFNYLLAKGVADFTVPASGPQWEKVWLGS